MNLKKNSVKAMMVVMMQPNSKIILTITGEVVCENLPLIVSAQIKKDLTFENEQYKNASKYGGYVAQNISEYIYFYGTSKDETMMRVPRGYIFFLKNFLKKANLPYEIIDETLSFNKINVKFHGKLREYQAEAVHDIVNRYPVGVLESATGSGKTCMSIGVIANRKQPTLIIVHTKELLYQWQGAIKKFLDYDCGLIGDGQNDVKDITVGIINTVRNRIDTLRHRFGMIIVDEVHKVPSNTFVETVQQFPAKYYLGVSGTAFRRDGLGKAIFYHIGPRVHLVDKEMLHNIGAVLKPKIIRVPTEFRASKNFADSEMMPYASIIKKLTDDFDRNKLICRTVYADLKKNKELVLIVSDRLQHLTELSNMLNSVGIDNRVLSGKTNTTKRKKIITDVKNGECKILLSTLSLIKEGLDIDKLTCLCLTTPVRFSGIIIQLAGRILRPAENKIPRIYDFRDDEVTVLRNSGFARDTTYRKQWG